MPMGKPTGRGLRDYSEPFFLNQAPGSLRASPPGMSPPEAMPYQSVREIPFDAWEAYAFVVGVNPVWLDTANILRPGRRSVLVINAHVANGLWLGHSSSVAVNNGAFVPAGGGAIALPLSERAQVWAVATAAGTVVSLCQFV